MKIGNRNLGKYSEKDLENAGQIWAPPQAYSIEKIEEFPTEF